MTDAEALRLLSDERAIRRLVARYSDAVSRRDEATWASTWTEDATWDVGMMKAEGREAVVETWRQLMGQFRFVTQLPQSGILDVDGDRATGTWHFIEIGWPAEGAGTLTLGHYRDVYRREGGDWLFETRTFRIVYMGSGDLSGHLIGHPDAPLA